MNKPTICKACGKLMGTATHCPYCGAARNSVSTNITYMKRALTSPHTSYYKLILYATLGMYVLSTLVGTFIFKQGLVNALISGPNGYALLFMGASNPNLYDMGHWWVLFTATFLHGGLMHIGFNMFALYQIGPLIEQATSRSFFIVAYLLTGAGGFALSALGGNLSVGGSAGLYGLIGCGIVISFILGNGKDDPLFRGLIQWLIYGFVFALLIPNIDHYAHIGGLLSGLAIGYIWTVARRSLAFRKVTEKLAIGLAIATIVGLIQCIMTYYKYV